MEAVLEKCIERISRSLDTVADSHVQIFLDERRAIREELAELRETNHLEFKKVLPFDPSKRRARP